MSALDGSQLNGPLVVFLVILAASASVAIGCTVHRLFYDTGTDSSEGGFKARRSPRKII
jgi:hypothetical protein